MLFGKNDPNIEKQKYNIINNETSKYNNNND